MKKIVLASVMVGLLASCAGKPNANISTYQVPAQNYNLPSGVPAPQPNIEPQQIAPRPANGTVLFEQESVTLTPQAEAVLDQQIAYLGGNTLPITVQGHADETGTREHNIGLSAQRATAVKQYMVSRGIDPTRITIVPLGKERPAATCSDESCWALNRRAVVSSG